MPRGGKRPGAGRKKASDYHPKEIQGIKDFKSIKDFKDFKSKLTEENLIDVCQREPALQESESHKLGQNAGSSQDSAGNLHRDGSSERPQIAQGTSRDPLHGDRQPELHVQREGIEAAGGGQLLAQQIHSKPETTGGSAGTTTGDGSTSASDSNPRPTQGSTGITDEQIAKLRDPNYFVRAFCLSKLDGWQSRLLDDAKAPGRSALKGANGIGKTVIIACLILYFLSTVKNCRVVVVSGVFRQLKMMVDHLQSLLVNFHGWKVLRGSHELHSPLPQNKAIWFATDSPGAAQGQHSTVTAVEMKDLDQDDNPFDQGALKEFAQKDESSCLVLIRDECRDIPDEVKGATDTFGADWIFDFSNPGPEKGWFYEIFARLGNIYRLHTVTAFDSSYIKQTQIEEMKEIHGVDSPRYRNSILAEFSDASIRNMVKFASWERCASQPPPWQHSNRNIAGLDVSAARKGGDECVLYWRQGNRIHEPIIFTGYLSEVELCGAIIRKLKELSIKVLMVDNGGIGSPVIAIIESMLSGNGIQIHRINFGAKPKNDAYENLATELYANLENQLAERRWILPKDAITKAQAIGREFETLMSGKVRLIPKSKLSKSPDRSDALVMCNQEPPRVHAARTFEMGGDNGRDVEPSEYCKTVGGIDLGG